MLFGARNKLNGNYIVIIYFDYAKAFDKVSHEKLLLRLRSYGIVEVLLNGLNVLSQIVPKLFVSVMPSHNLLFRLLVSLKVLS